MVPLKFCTFWWIIASRAMILKCIEIIMHKLGKSDSELQHSWFSLGAAMYHTTSRESLHAAARKEVLH